MTDEPTTLIAIMLLFVGVAFLFLGAFPGWTGLRNGPAPARKAMPHQISALRRNFDGRSTGELDVDWMLYKDVSKEAVIDLAADRGWRYAGQTITEEAWWLSFTFDPSVPHRDAASRLSAELAGAEIDGTSRYRIDADRYLALSASRQREIITAAGWEPVSGLTGRSEFLVVTKPGSELGDIAEPKFAGIQPHAFRGNPAVVERARRFQQEHGFDPLAPESLDNLRQRNNYWSKRFFIAGAVAGVLLATGPFPLLIGMNEFPSETAVTVGWAMLGFGGGFALLAAWFQYLRKREIGTYLKLLPELRRIHRDTDPQRHRG